MARHFVAADNDMIDCGTGVRGSDIQTIVVAAWIKLDSHTAEGKIVSRWDETTERSWLLTVYPDGTVLFVILATDNVAYGVFSVTTLSDDVWYHVAGSYDGTTLKVYVDGAVDNTSTISKTMKTGTKAMRIGNDLAENAPFDGTIAEVTAVTGSSPGTLYPLIVSALASGASPSDCEGIGSSGAGGQFHIGYWPLLGTDPEADLTYNGNPGTVTGATVVDHPSVRSITAFRV